MRAWVQALQLQGWEMVSAREPVVSCTHQCKIVLARRELAMSSGATMQQLITSAEDHGNHSGIQIVACNYTVQCIYQTLESCPIYCR